jgi:hypothetical protein
MRTEKSNNVKKKKYYISQAQEIINKNVNCMDYDLEI